MTKQTRKTRIVCISDTHNQTPKLPRGDVLIHAGDLTNQGSYAELEKAVEWLEKQEFEKVVVVGGNHDITLDPVFFDENKGKWKWPSPQDPQACKAHLTNSPKITYLENTSAHVQLTRGPRTHFTIYGSPCSPNPKTVEQGGRGREWAFQYTASQAKKIWESIPEGIDILITHTPPLGHCDSGPSLLDDTRTGCPILLSRLAIIKPRLHVCGHIHIGRGAQTIHWAESGSGLVESVKIWNDPGEGSSKKISLVDLSHTPGRGKGRGLGTSLTRQQRRTSGRRIGRASFSEETLRHQPPSGDENLIPTSSVSLDCFALGGNETRWGGGAVEADDLREGGHGFLVKGRSQDMFSCKKEETTTVINPAYLGPRIAGKTTGYNKPIVVDVDLPVGDEDEEAAEEMP